MATMTTSPMTDGQIERAIEIFRAQLRKHASELQSEAVQQVFGQREFAVELVGVLRKRAEAVMKKILTFLRTVRIPAQPAVTTSEEYFKEAGVVVAGSNFKAQFYGLEVPATEEAELAVRKLEETSVDAPILAELCDKAEISVSQFRAFLAENRGSSEWFIFYLKGKDGKVWAVSASWRVGLGGWRVFADSVSGPSRWFQGLRVVSQV